MKPESPTPYAPKIYGTGEFKALSRTLKSGATVKVSRHTGKTPEHAGEFNHVMLSNGANGEQTKLIFSLSRDACLAMIEMYVALDIATPITEPNKMENVKMKLAEEGGMIFDFETGLELAVMCDNSPESPARQMLHATNCHDELLEMAHTHKVWMQGSSWRYSDEPTERDTWQKTYDKIEAIIAKATGAE